jgi:hypothetical protein
VNPIFVAALEIQDLCRAQGWRFCFIGGVAVQRWGEPRLTQDVDVTLLTGFGAEERYIDALLARFRGRFDDARAFALQNRVALISSSGGIPVDVALGAMPFEERAVARASDYPFADAATLFTCGAEDLIVFKVFAGRAKDWLDIEGIAARQAGRLDERLIRSELEPLLTLKGDTHSLQRLQAVLQDTRA